MAPRNRSQVYDRAKGTWTRFGVTFGGHRQVVGVNNCSDQTGSGDCAPLSIEHYDATGGLMHSIVPQNYNSSYYENYAVDLMDNSSNFPHHTNLPGSPSDVAVATNAAARTNPSRPYVDVPVNVLQLGEVTRLIRSRGQNLVREAGRENLRYQFGIAPLVGDLVKLTNFNDQLARRIKELERLQSSNGLRRTTSHGVFGASGTYPKTLQSQGGLYNGDFFASTQQIVKCHCRWLPTADLSKMSGQEKMSAAMRSVLGLTVDFGTLWQVIPWTWLIDWGSNVSQFFTANRNIIPAQLAGVHVMRETSTRYEFAGYQTDKVRIEPIKVHRVSKTRNPSFVAPVAHFPVLTGNQMGILASLSVTRR
jgi:hypothetical protein